MEEFASSDFMKTKPRLYGVKRLSSVHTAAGRGLKLGSCLTLRNELSKETHALTKQEIFLGKGSQAESRRVRGPRRTALPCGSQSQVLW